MYDIVEERKERKGKNHVYESPYNTKHVAFFIHFSSIYMTFRGVNHFSIKWNNFQIEWSSCPLMIDAT